MLKQLSGTAWSWVDYPELTLDDKRTPTPFGELVHGALNRYADSNEYTLDIEDVQVNNDVDPLIGHQMKTYFDSHLD
ncbi:hypothetical protein JXB12_03535 [candidate division KSB1 bacterium]|nr:hypothetical protein [candidate division KSB1 bacterium]